MAQDKNGHLGKIVFGQSWGIFLFRGIVTLLIGIMLLANPAVMITAFLIATGIFFAITGIAAVISAFRMPPQAKTRWVIMFYGLISIIAGMIMFFNPAKAEVVIILVIAIWALFTGGGELASAVSMKASWKQKLLAGLTGLISVVFGFIFLTHPGDGLKAIAWVFGLYFVINGVFLIMLGFSLYSLKKQLIKQAPQVIDTEAEEVEEDK